MRKSIKLLQKEKSGRNILGSVRTYDEDDVVIFSPLSLESKSGNLLSHRIKCSLAILDR